VIGGRLGVRCGDVEAVLEAGDVFFLPRGVPHSLWNDGDEPARVLDVYSPPGIEAIFATGARSSSSSST
jgi:mannose-6-phosphate isomerase-like protein (cupin superfamily)